MRLLLSLILIMSCALLSASGVDSRLVLGNHADLRATPVALDTLDPARTKVGALRYLGGVSLHSRDPAFGGLSAMQVVGDRFTLVSDGGNVVRFRMGPDFTPREASFADIGEGPGTGWEKRDRDVESLTHDPVTGRIWLGFERANAIWRYDASLIRAQRHAAPPAMADWSANGGAESMARLRDGRFLVISESARPKGVLAKTGRIALMFAGDPTEAPHRGFRFTYVPPAGFDPSDVAELPDGRLLVLTRQFSIPDLFTAKLVIVDPRAIRAGAAVSGREIAHFASPLLHDNFEALAVTQEGGDTIIWMASDDNQQVWERSFLLKFRLEP